jgi:ElaB/YqjD/DUF883 family membrane-anchored ribosome-binding protein
MNITTATIHPILRIISKKSELNGDFNMTTRKNDKQEEIENDIKEAADKAKKTASKVADDAKETAEDVKDKASTAAKDAKETASKVANDAKETASKVAKDAKETVSKVADDAKETASKVAGEAKEVAGNFTEQLEVAGSQVMSKIRELIEQGNVRRIVVRTSDDRVLVDAPLNIGAGVGVILAYFAGLPLLLLSVGIAAVARVKIEVVREVSDGDIISDSKGKSRVEIKDEK